MAFDDCRQAEMIFDLFSSLNSLGNNDFNSFDIWLTHKKLLLVSAKSKDWTFSFFKQTILNK